MFDLLATEIHPRDSKTRIHQHAIVAAESPLGISRAVMIESNRPGPCVVVVGGQHGDEPAGYAAAALVAAVVRPQTGSLLVIPQANPAGCAAHSRFAPDWAGGGSEDINRCWVRPAGDGIPRTSPELQHAAQLWATITGCCAPDLLIDLHESLTGAHPEVLPGYGHDAWAFLEDAADVPLAEAAGLHVELSPLPHTLTWAARQRGIPALAIETRRRLPWRERVLRHLFAVLSIAERAGCRWRAYANAIEPRLS